MTDALIQSPGATDLPTELTNTFYSEIEQREKQGSTGLGEGIAFPHARINGLERPLIAFATISKGVEFGAPDKVDSTLVFLFLFPAQRVELGVKIHSTCSRFLIQPAIREALLASKNTDEIREIMEQNSLEIDAPIIALDLMRNKRFRLTPEMPLHKATQMMHRNRTVASPVLNENNKVIGELNCNQIFERELPDYIKGLHSVPHIPDFKPFQNYFNDDKNTSVEDFMNPCEASSVNEDATILEIVFLLSVKKLPLLYVCRDNQLLGVIDAVTVADKIFNM
jgi:mannitol/fructose-specific phosphotransferase system IIA component (Ntr-type)